GQERHLPQNEAEEQKAGGGGESALGGERDGGEVERQEDGDGVVHHAVAGQAVAAGEVQQGTVRERQHQQREQQAAAMEPPAEQHAGAEHGVGVERRERREQALQPFRVRVDQRREDDRGFRE